MTEARQTVFLIPCYQPTQIFPDLLRRLREADLSQIVVVDDGSGPAYAPIFQRVKQMPGVTLLTNAINLGKGAALKHGMNHILVNYPDCIGVVTADADGQHAVADILKLAAGLKEQPNRVVFGARQFSSEVPLRSRFGNTVSRYVYRFLIGLSLMDTQTGLRGVPKRLMELCLGIRANRYEFETEQLVLIKSAGMPVYEIPIETIYIDDNRESHFRPLLDSAQIYYVLLRYAASSLVTALTDLVVFATAMTWFGDLLLANAAGRLAALWVQFALLQKFVFRRDGSAMMFVAYLGLVLVSGAVSTAMQIQLANLVPVPILDKIIAEVLVFLFNFLFLRDLVFGVSGDGTRD
jgi:glycosyltransferase involved in cell wall biosynthesis